MKRDISKPVWCLLGVVVSSLCLAAPTALAYPGTPLMPRRGYIIVPHPEETDVLARIGRRTSAHEGQRAALRMLARLLCWYPSQQLFRVEWEAPDAKGQLHSRSFRFDAESEEENDEWGHSIEVGSDAEEESAFYRLVTRRVVQAVARRNGILQDLTRYGAVDLYHEVTLDLGVRASYDAGSRATMRTLARRLRGPFSAEYTIRYYYPPPRHPYPLMRVETSYSPFYDHGSFIVERFENETSEGTILVSCAPVQKRFLIAAGCRWSNFSGILKRFSRKA